MQIYHSEGLIMTQQEFWNKKFSKEEFFYGDYANEFLISNKNLLKNAKSLLFLGEGEGRNAIEFAKNDTSLLVDAIDASDIGLNKLKVQAKKLNLNNIYTTCLDLNNWVPQKKYDGILSSYLHMHEQDRDLLFDKIEVSLEKNAYFMIEVFSKKQINYTSGGPKDLSLLYEKDDFLKRFNSCEKIKIDEEIIMLNEGNGHKGEACVIRVILKKK
ncbi:class I SAM-dependent methyltransferase [Arcobacter sp. CECT 8985]|uniref:class I SAM-dependent methyltransferase n=1 Tax=Arcobacter sp. CECT 8985 TaxID=1935424 RepID=UPI002159E2A0|nr:class I SAM-dependent methyltransferase [Arcobacter sp. CECT 8985]